MIQPLDEDDLENLERATRPQGYTKPRKKNNISDWQDVLNYSARDFEQKADEQVKRNRMLLSALKQRGSIRYNAFKK